MTDWQPTASLEMLQTRARLLSSIRAFFAEKDILEVDTPLLSQAGNTEPAIESFVIQQGAVPSPLFLNTSPEFAMKRLLAAGYGDMFQLCPAFRQGEQGPKHNPEFTLLEWYRNNFDHHALMGEVNALVRHVARDDLELERSEFYTYQDAMLTFAEVDPFKDSIEQLEACVKKAGIDVVGMAQATYDNWLDLIMSQVVEKNLPQNRPVFIYDYPASQAALAKIRKGEPDVAERFELYINGMELANGFHELQDAQEQTKRFQHDQQQRIKLKQQGIPSDMHLIAALKHGLPGCAGVALGIERLQMVLTGATHINEVIAFPLDRA